MSKKNKKHREGIVFSTDPDHEYMHGEEEAPNTLPPRQQDLRVELDRKRRKGKEVTLITGFIGQEEDLKDLGRSLKQQCGSGGSAKEGEIIIQGDHREKVLNYLRLEGYGVKAKGG